ncbi:hypothetical protein KIN20_028968 [Parelaphostrongylus tenuis]|uniref:Nucleoporin Nup133/Nup155-like C-terminal domain-containing protein n=1 Tax=Parelaphostrongylus tenuis TaxID=148309 RepID=A0AAD5WF42_PARTN|nr:hypothetical protein KIN20_028968 [Parelaphostrongylus tenuis]
MAIKESMNVHTPRQQEVVKLLDGPILPLQELLQKFAIPYELYKVQLAIFHCANLYREEPIMALWENIIQSEFKHEGEVSERLLCTLHELQAIYDPQSGGHRVAQVEFSIRSPHEDVNDM